MFLSTVKYAVMGMIVIETMDTASIILSFGRPTTPRNYNERLETTPP